MLPCSEKKYGERRRGRGSDTCRRFLLGAGQNPPEVACWRASGGSPERQALAARGRHRDSDRLIFRPRTALR